MIYKFTHIVVLRHLINPCGRYKFKNKIKTLVWKPVESLTMYTEKTACLFSHYYQPQELFQ